MDNDTREGRTWLDAVAGIVLVVQTLVLLATSGVYVAYALVDDSSAQPQWLSLAALAAVLGIGLALATRGWWRANRWSRSAVMTWQVLQGAVAAAIWTRQPGIGVALLASAVLVVIAVLAQANRRGDHDFAA